MNGRRSTRVRLVRNLAGDVVHRAGCRSARPGSVHWRWADENPDEDWKTTGPWLKACKHCDPPSPLSAGDEPKDLMAALKRSLDDARGQKGAPDA